MYIIRNNPDTCGQALFWTGAQVVGICRGSEAVRYESRTAAQAVIDAGLPAPRLYGWVVAPESHASLPRMWSPRPGDRGYDLMCWP